MSKIGWRWWDLGKDGSLQSVNHIVWPPNEPLQAACEFGSQANHRWYLEHEDGRRTPLPKGMGYQAGLNDGMSLGGGNVLRMEPPPASYCHCGYWAFWDSDLASALPKTGYFKTTKVFGVIEAWGEIVEHELGFRAEWVIPRGVVVLRGRLHDAYDVHRFGDIPSMIKVFDDEGLSEQTGEHVEDIGGPERWQA